MDCIVQEWNELSGFVYLMMSTFWIETIRSFIFNSGLWIGLLLLNSCQNRFVDSGGETKPPTGFMNETVLKAALWLGWVDLMEADPPIPPDIEVFKDIEYKKVDSLSLQLDIYKQKNISKPTPLILFIHGGAWRTGKRSDYLPYLLDYAKKGFVTATVSYRLVKQALFPAAVQDVNCALQWIRANAAKYQIDPDRIVLLGGSAGGHLAMMIGYGGENELFNQDCNLDTQEKVKAVINFYGPADLTTPYAISMYQVKDFLGTEYDKNPVVFRDSSPRFYISADDPPTLIFHGTIDSLVPVSQSDSLQSWLNQAGVPNVYHRLKGWPHAMDVSVKVNRYCQQRIDEFLDKYL